VWMEGGGVIICYGTFDVAAQLLKILGNVFPKLCRPSLAWCL
jgi:hypothetical protein